MSKPTEEEALAKKEELKQKLKEKMSGKRIGRMGKSQQQALLNKQLTKAGIDPETFMKKLQKK